MSRSDRYVLYGSGIKARRTPKQYKLSIDEIDKMELEEIQGFPPIQEQSEMLPDLWDMSEEVE